LISNLLLTKKGTLSITDLENERFVQDTLVPKFNSNIT